MTESTRRSALALARESSSKAAGAMLLLAARRLVEDAAALLRHEPEVKDCAALLERIDRACASLVPQPEPTCPRCIRPLGDSCPMASPRGPDIICPAHGLAGHLWRGSDPDARDQVRRIGIIKVIAGRREQMRRDLMAELGIREPGE